MIELTMPFTEMSAAEFQEHLDRRSVNTHDADSVAGWFEEDGVQRVIPSGTEASGRDAVREAMAGLFNAFPDFHLTVRDLFTAGDRTCIQCVSTGTHQAEYAGIPATGRRIELDLCLVFRWGPNALAAEEVVYYDAAAMLVQLGVLPSS